MIVRLVALAGLCTGCGRIDFDAPGDGGGGDASGTADACTFGPFSAPRELAELNSGSQEYGPWLSEDRLEILFSSARTGVYKLYRARRTSPTVPFDPPALMALGLPNSDDAFVTDDGLTLWFDTANSGAQLMVATRATTAVEFGNPQPVPELASGQTDNGPTLTSDELTIVFSSTRTGTVGNLDLYVATRAHKTDPFGTPVALSALNTTSDDAAASLSGDGSSMVYASSVLTPGLLSMLTTHFTSPTQPSPPQLFAAEIGDATGDDNDPMLTRDGRTIVFSSTRAGGTGTYDLYIADRACL